MTAHEISCELDSNGLPVCVYATAKEARFLEVKVDGERVGDVSISSEPVPHHLIWIPMTPPVGSHRYTARAVYDGSEIPDVRIFAMEIA